MYGISNQFGVSVTELASLNNVNANTLQIGQELIIPVDSGSNPDNMFMYTVKKGDSLYSISKIYGTSVDEIKKLNYLTSNNLVIGQILRIPEMYTKPEDMVIPNYVNYEVKKGDSLYSIAKKYGVLVDEIMKDNTLNNMTLKIGQVLRIRSGSGMVEECFGEEYTTPVNQDYLYYNVLPGDSLYSIAKKYNTSVSNLINLNSLKSNVLSIGQVLKVPNTNINTYVVVKGDSLYSIAKKFNVTVDYLKKKNNLLSNNLSIGQKLMI